MGHRTGASLPTCFVLSDNLLRARPAGVPRGSSRAVTVNDKRPVNLALQTIHFPLPAIASVFHRISGFALFGVIPAVLWAWQQSLASPEAFLSLTTCIAFRLIAVVVLAGLIYHVLAGGKHLLMDIGVGETLEGGRRLALAVLAGSAVLIALMALWVMRGVAW